jgi:DNA-binding transcriptional regulator YdaS (Cro superfamily)
MDLKNYLVGSKISQSALARELGVTTGFVWQLCTKHRLCPIGTALHIERWSDGAVTRADLRDDWQSIWPEYSPPSAESAA